MKGRSIKDQSLLVEVSADYETAAIASYLFRVLRGDEYILAIQPPSVNNYL